MKTKLPKIILSFVVALFTSLSILPTTNVFADPSTETTATSNVCELDVPASVKESAGCNGNSNQIENIVINILNVVIGLAGLIAVIFIIAGGFSYMTSSGEAAKLEKAKKTILYAVIGLVICILAFAIVNFVIKNIIVASS